MSIGAYLAVALALAGGLMVVAWFVYRVADKASWVDVFWVGNLAVLAVWYAASAAGDATLRVMVANVGGRGAFAWPCPSRFEWRVARST